MSAGRNGFRTSTRFTKGRRTGFAAAAANEQNSEMLKASAEGGSPSRAPRFALSCFSARAPASLDFFESFAFRFRDQTQNENQRDDADQRIEPEGTCPERFEQRKERKRDNKIRPPVGGRADTHG